MSSDPPIIVGGGGSIEITFDEQAFPGKGGKYANKDKKIVSVEVEDHNTSNIQTVTIPANGKCTIRVHTG
jgi:hypothetical protein